MHLNTAHRTARDDSGSDYRFVVRDHDVPGGYAVADAFELESWYAGDEPVAVYFGGDFVD